MKTFLVLEDEPFIAMDLKFAFEDAGHEAVTASDNEEALRCIEQRSIAGAVLDVSLGRGVTCAETASALLNRKIPFVLHTGDLNRVGEYLREIDAPVIAKLRPAEDVVNRVVTMVASNA